MTKEEKLFTRKYNDLRFLIINSSEYDLLKASAILRHLLIDGENLIDIVNRNHRIKIKFKVDGTFKIDFQNGYKICYMPIQLGKLKMKFSINLKELDKTIFLKLPILQGPNQSFTILEIIKHIANKEGGVHFESKENKNSDQISSVENTILLQAIKVIGQIVLLSLMELKLEIIKFPENLPLFAHYDTGPDGYIQFQGLNQFMGTKNMNGQLKNGFGVLFEIKIQYQHKKGNRVIYELGGGENCFKFKMQINKDGALECFCKINSNTKLKVNYPDFQRNFMEKWTAIASFIEFENSNALFTLVINNRLVDKSETNFRNRNNKIEDQTLGSNLNGKQNAAFMQVEQIILDDKIEPDKKLALLEYLEGNWHR